MNVRCNNTKTPTVAGGAEAQDEASSGSYQFGSVLSDMEVLLIAGFCD